jgi:hypothetical protein
MTARTAFLKIRVSERERAVLARLAAKAGRSLSDWVRECVGLKGLHAGPVKGGPPPGRKRTMKSALVTLILVALPSFAQQPIRLDVPRSLEGERVIVVGTPMRASVVVVGEGRGSAGYVDTRATYAPRVISAEDLLGMVRVNGTWSDTVPACPDVVLPIQPMPDDPVKIGGSTPDFHGCSVGCFGTQRARSVWHSGQTSRITSEIRPSRGR